MNKQKLTRIMIFGFIIVIFGFILLTFGYKNNDKINKDINSYRKNIGIDNIDKLNINKIYGSLYQSGGSSNLKEKISYLESVGDLEKSSFLSSFLGDYKKATENREKLCGSNIKSSDSCTKVDLTFNYDKAIDNHGNLLDNLNLSMDGNFIGKLKNGMKLNSNDNFTHRIKIAKKGYLDYYSKIVLLNNPYTKIQLQPNLLKSEYHKKIKSTESFIYDTKNIKYNIGANSFVNQDGTDINGDIDLYFFDIGAKDGDLSVLNLDSFDENGSYIGSSMTTLGMPLLKAYSGEKELKIKSGISGFGKIQNLERALGIDLVKVPKNVWLKKQDLDRFNIPPFWHLDQNIGVWYSSEMKILDTSGNYEFKLF